MIAEGSFVLLIALVLAASAPAADPEAGRSLALPCVACHGQSGRSTDPRIPDLAGQRSDCLVAQLWDFRKRWFPSANPYWRAERRDPTMNHQATNMSDEAIADLAAHFSGLSCGPAPNDDAPRRRPRSTAFTLPRRRRRGRARGGTATR
jgi:cytochrome c553